MYANCHCNDVQELCRFYYTCFFAHFHILSKSSSETRLWCTAGKCAKPTTLSYCLQGISLSSLPTATLFTCIFLYALFCCLQLELAFAAYEMKFHLFFFVSLLLYFSLCAAWQGKGEGEGVGKRCKCVPTLSRSPSLSAIVLGELLSTKLIVCCHLLLILWLLLLLLLLLAAQLWPCRHRNENFRNDCK